MSTSSVPGTKSDRSFAIPRQSTCEYVERQGMLARASVRLFFAGRIRLLKQPLDRLSASIVGRQRRQRPLARGSVEDQVEARDRVRDSLGESRQTEDGGTDDQSDQGAEAEREAKHVEEDLSSVITRAGRHPAGAWIVERIDHGNRQRRLQSRNAAEIDAIERMHRLRSPGRRELQIHHLKRPPNPLAAAALAGRRRRRPTL